MNDVTDRPTHDACERTGEDCQRGGCRWQQHVAAQPQSFTFSHAQQPLTATRLTFNARQPLTATRLTPSSHSQLHISRSHPAATHSYTLDVSRPALTATSFTFHAQQPLTATRLTHIGEGPLRRVPRHARAAAEEGGGGGGLHPGGLPRGDRGRRCVFLRWGRRRCLVLVVVGPPVHK